MILLRGLLWIATGVLVFARPGITLLSLTLFFGAAVFADGVVSVVSAISGRKEHEDWWVLLLSGVSGVAVGALLLVSSQTNPLAVLFYIALWAVAAGILQIVAAVRLRKEIEGEVWLGLSGLSSVLFGALLVVNPTGGALALLWLIGAYAITFGIALVMLSLRVHSLAKHVGGTVGV
jgi:uncharacterized membrane protein HdeD (DUF308 family)